ncbi:uncharacterized protein V1518DRAFT_419861 [Limtongia smithiae]|uniref:uncharacterized protein n=1 Tax=Limtongia smithiae TaxID=1125753 RepID=UPI0034D01816
MRSAVLRSVVRPSTAASFRMAQSHNARASLIAGFRTNAILRSDAKPATTPTSKLEKLKAVPAELYPLFIALVIGLGAAGVAIGRKFLYDPSVRLNRSSK